MSAAFHIDVNCQQNNCDGERVCGDVFLTKKVKEEGRIIVVLSDGMGHGIKANMLGILSATMAVNFTKEHKQMERIAEIILNTLPIDSEKKTSFSTFSIADIEADGKVTILEYENPQCLILRGTEVVDPEWTCLLLNTKRKVGKEIKSCTFYAQKEDRIILYTDGISQSGMGTKQFPTGWGVEEMHKFTRQQVEKTHDISAAKLAFKIISEAYKNDGFVCKDDTSSTVIYFREPRKLIICTGPPILLEKDTEFAALFKDFDGKKVVCGGTTGDILKRELNLSVEEGKEQDDPELPPLSFMEGVDLYTEGILTLSKVNNILKKYNNSYKLDKGPADRIVRMLLDSDDIFFLVGTKINEAHQDPNVPIDLEMRRTVVRRIEKILEENFLKHVSVKFY
jgi:hypothetical protein